MSGNLTAAEMAEFERAHNAGVESFGKRDYKVLVDLRGVAAPFGPDATVVMENTKRYSSAHGNFRGSAVLVATKFIGLQHQRTSMSGGVMETELITDDETQAMRHLQTVDRR